MKQRICNKNIKYLILDVDGTLTDGKIYMGENGEICKAFNVKDGYGIANIIIPSNIIPVIITGRKSKIVEKRCGELGITWIYQDVEDKCNKIKEILLNTVDSYKNIAYMGDDINDLSAMYEIKEKGGIIGCPADAVKEIKEIAHFISEKKGGEGAVREFIEWIVEI